MANPITFSSTTPNAGLPLLFSGQSQKEFFINQSLETIDALLSKAVESSSSAPPSDPGDGACYLVAPDATAEWSGRADHIAVRIAGGWHFVAPTEGMELYDRATEQTLIFRSQWIRSAAPTNPAGGTVIDTEARTAIIGLIEALKSAGVLTEPT
ncbi:MAG: DUF2793 domain-containing protein [Pseudomonadota bacterium]